MKVFAIIWNVMWKLVALLYLAAVVVIFGFPKTYAKFYKRWINKVEEVLDETE